MTNEELSKMLEAITAHVKANDGSLFMMVLPEPNSNKHYFSLGGKMSELCALMVLFMERCPELKEIAGKALKYSQLYNVTDHEKN